MLISDYLSSNIIHNLHSFFDFTHFRELGQKYKNIFVQFLVQMKTSKFAFEINWPLVRLSYLDEAAVIHKDYPNCSTKFELRGAGMSKMLVGHKVHL